MAMLGQQYDSHRAAINRGLAAKGKLMLLLNVEQPREDFDGFVD
jgi:hypothetical protein